jgi:putative addiction module component (TIGR02574 family)
VEALSGLVRPHGAMVTDKASIIEAICNAIARGDDSALTAAVKEYPFVPPTNAGRRYTAIEATRIFVRDGFVDRYSGARLIHPAVLRLLSKFLPREFPFHPNWKMSETHPAYWELVPTVDHIVPVARGGADSEENWATTSMLRNAAKANWTLGELGWTLLPPADFSEWDGLTGWLVSYVKEHGVEGQDRYVLRWYQAARTVCGVTPRSTRTRQSGGRRLAQAFSGQRHARATLSGPANLSGVAMSTVVAEIEAKIRSLSLEDKTELVRALIAELDGPADPDVERAWLEEAQRRYREVIEGKVQPVPGERVFENLRARLKR